jgi:two-component system, cell cycle sensor histidine kinase and response regulator CckA
MGQREGRRAAFGLWIAVAILCAVGVFAYMTNQAVVEKTAWVEHTHVVIEHIGIESTTLMRAITIRRGYALDPDPASLATYAAVIKTLGVNEAALRSLTLDNPTQQRHLDELAPLMKECVRRFDAAIETTQRQRDSRELERNEMQVAGALYVQVDAILSKMTDEELRLLILRRHASDTTVLVMRIAQLAGTVASLALLLVAFGRLRRATARRFASEQTARQGEQTLARILTAIGDGVIATDAEGRVIRVNRAAEQLTGWTAAACCGKPASEIVRFIDAQTREPIADPIARVLRERVALGFERSWLLVREDGSELAVASDSCAPARDDKGTIHGAVLVFRDVSEEQRARTFFRSLVERNTDGIALTTPEGVLTYASPAAARMLGRTAEAVIGTSLIDYCGPEHADDAVVECFVNRPDGTSSWIEMTSTNMIANPAVGAIVRNMRDLTERQHSEATLRRTEEQLRQAQKMDAVGRLAGGVAHDFNNMLSVILSYTACMLEDLTPTDPMHADLDEIRKAGERAADLTRQLLMFSRQQVIEPRNVDLNAVLTNMQRMLQRLVGEDVEVAVTKTTTGNVLADPSGIEQVVMNLVVNARDAMPTGGKLTIETADVILDEDYASHHIGVTPGAYVMLAVSDSGTGMDAATQERIFDPFFTTKEIGKGTGLGLSTVFGIVTQSRGSIWVYSELGLGTTFKVYLPLAAPLESRRRNLATSPLTLRGNETILLVEDEEQVRAVASGILSRAGYKVDEVRTAGEALLHCEQHPEAIHLLLTDVVMPQMSGPELAKRLAPSRPEMRVLCMSGYTDDSIVRHGVLEASFAFLQKPLTPDALRRKVREVLDRAVA